VPKVTSAYNYLLLCVQAEVELGGLICEHIGNETALLIQKEAILRNRVKI
jgi:hypothetical protein